MPFWLINKSVRSDSDWDMRHKRSGLLTQLVPMLSPIGAWDVIIQCKWKIENFHSRFPIGCVDLTTPQQLTSDKSFVRTSAVHLTSLTTVDFHHRNSSIVAFRKMRLRAWGNFLFSFDELWQTRSTLSCSLVTHWWNIWRKELSIKFLTVSQSFGSIVMAN